MFTFYATWLIKFRVNNQRYHQLSNCHWDVNDFLRRQKIFHTYLNLNVLRKYDTEFYPPRVMAFMQPRLKINWCINDWNGAISQYIMSKYKNSAYKVKTYNL